MKGPRETVIGEHCCEGREASVSERHKMESAHVISGSRDNDAGDMICHNTEVIPTITESVLVREVAIIVSSPKQLSGCM